MKKADPVQVVAMRRDGWKLEAIGAHFGISRQRVHQILDDAGEPRPPRRTAKPQPRLIGHLGRKAHEERNTEILRLRAAGLTELQIADRLGLTKGQVAGTLDRYGNKRSTAPHLADNRVLTTTY